MDTMTRIALIGFGVIGQAFAHIIKNKRKMLEEKFGFKADIVAINGRSKGSIYDHTGLDLGLLLGKFDETGTLESYPKGVKGLTSLETITQTSAEIIVEVTTTNIETGMPALKYIKTALREGKHVVTSNKGPVALAFKELNKLAIQNHVQFRFESTVLSGTPAINFALENLAGHNLYGVKGIINGTTNYILTKMEQGEKYDDALREAQNLGYAEADPSADVEGWDSVAKIMILGNVLLDGELKIDDVERKGITEITYNDIVTAKSRGERIKLIAEAYSENGIVKAKVSPQRVHISDQLANVNGTLNALTVMTDGLLEVTVIGGGAGGVGTAHGLLSDILSIQRTKY
jgi:homoserine dehydrogenase